MATASGWVKVERRPGGYAIVTMCREPVNTLNLQLWRQLEAAVQECEQDPAVRGIIIASGLQRDIFTAGNDLMGLYAPKTSKEGYREFWVVQNTFLARLYRSPLLCIAAIRGACPAAGCNIAMCCDVRLMTEQGYIGLNEVAVGISVPEKWCELMARTIGHGPASQLLQFARMPTSQEALKLGLIDRLVPTDQLLPAAEQQMQELLKTVPDEGRRRTKVILRGAFAKEWEDFCHGEADGAWEMLSSPSVTKAVGAVLQRLSAGKKAKAKL